MTETPKPVSLAGPEPQDGAMPKPSTAVAALAFSFRDPIPRPILRPIATEVPVQVNYADMPFGIMMMTPADFEDFAYGFSLTEGVITGAGDIRGVLVEESAAAVRLRIDLVPARLHAHLARRRALAGRTSCGLCGIDDFAALPRAGAPAGTAPPIALAAIERALGQLQDAQSLNAATRAVHGAAWADLSGELRHLREDVGRHNGLDKLVGALLRAGIDPASGFIIVTSRASFEMVEKAATFGARTLIAISAPTALAIARAQKLDVTLVGIARADGIIVFHGAERIDAGRAPDRGRPRQ
jgi:FdhD protein